MENSFQKLQEQREAMLPPEIEHRLMHQMGTFSLFGRVVELFMPNALNTVARLIDGDCNPGDPGCRADEEEPEWRMRPRGIGPSAAGEEWASRWRQ